MTAQFILTIIAILTPIFHMLGFVSAIHAVLKVRTSQGAVAWCVSLITFPWIALPLYWIFGRSRFLGYTEGMRTHHREANDVLRRIGAFKANEFGWEQTNAVYEHLARMPFTTHNATRLLVDGDATFGAILEAIDQASAYILLEFFIVNDDELGRELKARLIKKAGEGVHIHFLFDEVGSKKLPGEYIKTLQKAGVGIHPFKTTRGWRNKFQLNFRNHRKIVVIDGKTAFVGGLNVGDEYMGRDKKFGHWRDTHMQVSGPAVQAVQLDWIGDWYWSTRTLPDLNWEPMAEPDGDRNVLVLGTSPADELESCSLFFVNAINTAKKRVWIASPYFVPDEAVTKALQLAALRGVDVRILLPQKADHLMVYLAAYNYLPDTDHPHMHIYRYLDGFLHQKVMLVDDHLSSIGTANLDNRSFRLNFEISMLIHNDDFAREVEAMLLDDFAHAREVTAEEYHKRSLLFRAAVRFATLLSPIL
ncbi:MAG: cardiolipin synthase [Spartobacteria bacterium]|nr:cardiolipin synthase [Spartobacteria bacterium]